MSNIEELKAYLEKELPKGFYLLVVPQKENDLFASIKCNPKNIPALDFLEALVKRSANWSGGGHLN